MGDDAKRYHDRRSTDTAVSSARLTARRRNPDMIQAARGSVAVATITECGISGRGDGKAHVIQRKPYRTPRINRGQLSENGGRNFRNGARRVPRRKHRL
jgi:hypothetical protein